MGTQQILCGSAIILFLALSLSFPVHASNYSITLNGNTFSVTWQINAWQNLTSFGKIVAYPANLTSTLSGNDLSAFTSALTNALQAKVPTVEITQPTVHIVSNSPNASCSVQCRLQWLNATVQFGVTENVPQTAGVAQYDVSWKAVRIENDLRAAGVSFNTLGQTYLVSALAPFVDFQPSPGRTMRVFVQNASVGRTSYISVTDRVVLFDMSAFQTPLANWNNVFDLSSQRQTWTSPNSGGFSAVATLNIIEQVTTSLVYVAAARISATVSAPLNAKAEGDTVFVDLSKGLWDGIAATAVLASLWILVGTVLLDRRMTRLSRAKWKKKSR